MNARLLLALISVSSTASASTYHVATTGSDTNAGTAAAPFKTLQRASNAVAAGDSVVIHAGTYTGFVVDAVGTQAAPITFSGDGVVNINGAATTDRDAVRAAGHLSRNRYMHPARVASGFRFRNGPKSSLRRSVRPCGVTMRCVSPTK